MIVAFSGLDGAGKSTQIEHLTQFLQEKNTKYYKFWSRIGYTPGFQYLKNILRYFLNTKLPKTGNSPQRDMAFNNPMVRKIWIVIAILDLFLFYGVWLRILHFRGYYIICDRYLLDSEIDLRINFPTENVPTWKLWKLLKIIIIKPNQNYIFTIPISESINRSKQKIEPFPDSPKILQIRLHYYREAIQNKVGENIDGLISENITNLKIINNLAKYS
ncbi:MAG: hypothetical protein HQ521_15750 [Bacteroidetes bacterium]|nr:hypothetical protein [Bacteroidota bacterium]